MTPPVNPKRNQSWIFIGRTDAEAETTILWPPDRKNWLIGKDPDAGEDWRQEEKGATEDEMIGWHHRLYGREFEQASGVGDGQGSPACCSPWSCKKSDTADWTELNHCIWITVLFSGTTECSWLILYLPRASSGVICFSKNPCSFNWTIRNPKSVLGVFIDAGLFHLSFLICHLSLSLYSILDPFSHFVCWKKREMVSGLPWWSSG